MRIIFICSCDWCAQKRRRFFDDVFSLALAVIIAGLLMWAIGILG